jgi:hypothetical protein
LCQLVGCPVLTYGPSDGCSVLAHISTPLSLGMFQRAVIQSPSGGVLRPIQAVDIAEDKSDENCPRKSLTSEQLPFYSESLQTTIEVDNLSTKTFKYKTTMKIKMIIFSKFIYVNFKIVFI